VSALVKREPIVIDVKPEEIVREGAAIRRAARKSSDAQMLRAMTREGKALVRAAESPDFWIGLAARLLKGK